MFGQLWVLEEHDVVVGARRGDCVPDALQRVLPILGIKHDLEDADFVGLGDLGVGQSGRKLFASLQISRAPVVQSQHRDPVTFLHRTRDSRSRRARAI